MGSKELLWFAGGVLVGWFVVPMLLGIVSGMGHGKGTA